jgi:hypothetical protein
MKTTLTIINIRPDLNEAGYLRGVAFTVVASTESGSAKTELECADRGGFPPPAGEMIEVEHQPSGSDETEAMVVKVYPSYTETELQAICETVAIQLGAFERARHDLMSKLTPVYVEFNQVTAGIHNGERGPA